MLGLKKADSRNKSLSTSEEGTFVRFLMPITLHPKVARALVNLSSIEKTRNAA